MIDDEMMQAEAWRVARLLDRFGVFRVRQACQRSGNRHGDRLDRWLTTDIACEMTAEVYRRHALLN